jgi:SAM-dependent methyltransferase
MRALQTILNRHFPDWKTSELHECSPSNRNLQQHCTKYTSSQFFGPEDLGMVTADGVRNENLEALTFNEATFDIFVTMDVLEHVFHPDKACGEIMRVLKPGGVHIFTAPKNKDVRLSKARALLSDGEIQYLVPPEYHGNPIGDGRSLVTWDYGDDFEVYLSLWSGYPTSTYVIRDRSLGLDGEYLEVFVTRKVPVR